MKLSEHQINFTKDVSKLICYASIMGIDLTFSEVQRTIYQQREYIREGKSKTFNSMHIKKLAVDFNIFINGVYDDRVHIKYYKILGDYWKTLDPLNRWGGDFKKLRDYVHFERYV